MITDSSFCREPGAPLQYSPVGEERAPPAMSINIFAADPAHLPRCVPPLLLLPPCCAMTSSGLASPLLTCDLASSVRSDDLIHVGQVVRLHRVLAEAVPARAAAHEARGGPLGEYSGRVGLSGPRGSRLAWLFFDGTPGASLDPLQSSGRDHTFEEEDRRRVEAMREFWAEERLVWEERAAAHGAEPVAPAGVQRLCDTGQGAALNVHVQVGGRKQGGLVPGAGGCALRGRKASTGSCFGMVAGRRRAPPAGVPPRVLRVGRQRRAASGACARQGGAGSGCGRRARGEWGRHCPGEGRYRGSCLSVWHT